MSEPVSHDLDETRDRERFPHLQSLMDGWFHQDFDLEGPDLETIIPKYADTSWRVDVEGTIADIRRFIDLYGADEATLREAVERILKPQVILEGWDGMTTREWLLRVAGLLSESLTRRSGA